MVAYRRADATARKFRDNKVNKDRLTNAPKLQVGVPVSADGVSQTIASNSPQSGGSVEDGLVARILHFHSIIVESISIDLLVVSSIA